MSKIFLNIPKNFVDIINSYIPEQFDNVYRLITHEGPFLPTDFYPTFVDDLQLERIRRAKEKGGPANVVASQTSENDVTFYSVSLITDINFAKRVKKRHPNTFPVIACGSTSELKGIANQDKSFHVSYYLYDYINLNPYTDFCEEEYTDDK